MSSIRVLVTGAKGRMGQEVVRAVTQAEGMEVVGTVEEGDDLAATIAATRPDAMVDFTVPEAVMGNIRIALAAKVVPLVGTTGISPTEVEEVRGLCASC
jgi:4-hydroxy-tetrahydrodipicolinate reductase